MIDPNFDPKPKTDVPEDPTIEEETRGGSGAKGARLHMDDTLYLPGPTTDVEIHGDNQPMEIGENLRLLDFGCRQIKLGGD